MTACHAINHGGRETADLTATSAAAYLQIGSDDCHVRPDVPLSVLFIGADVPSTAPARGLRQPNRPTSTSHGVGNEWVLNTQNVQQDKTWSCAERYDAKRRITHFENRSEDLTNVYAETFIFLLSQTHIYFIREALP